MKTKSFKEYMDTRLTKEEQKDCVYKYYVHVGIGKDVITAYGDTVPEVLKELSISYEQLKLMDNPHMGSTYDEFIATLSEDERREHEKDYRQIIWEELLLAVNRKDLKHTKRLITVLSEINASLV